MSALPPVIAIMGPTATGKTGLAMALLNHLDADLISVDSALVYRDMNIGTAKPTAAELARAPHQLIDVVAPDVAYSAGQFRRDAAAAVAQSRARGRVPILVGGTMLYFRALLQGIDELPEADAEVRARLDEEGAREGWPAMHDKLARIDPAAAQRIHPNDAQRIQRALEVFEVSGQPLTSWHKKRAPGLAPPVFKIGLMPLQRDRLHARIEARFDQMLASGFEDEVRALRERYALTTEHPSMRAVGYRQFCAWLDGEISYEQARADAMTATRRLARRQLTWLRSEEDLHQIDCAAPDVVAQALSYLRSCGVALQSL